MSPHGHRRECPGYKYHCATTAAAAAAFAIGSTSSSRPGVAFIIGQEKKKIQLKRWPPHRDLRVRNISRAAREEEEEEVANRTERLAVRSCQLMTF